MYLKFVILLTILSLVQCQEEDAFIKYFSTTTKKPIIPSDVEDSMIQFFAQKYPAGTTQKSVSIPEHFDFSEDKKTLSDVELDVREGKPIETGQMADSLIEQQKIENEKLQSNK